MEARPLSDEIFCGSRVHIAFEQFPVEIERCVLSLVLRMKMWRIMVAVEHANDYTKENAYSRHANCAL